MRRRGLHCVLLFPVLAVGVVSYVRADGACTSFTWNVEHERKLCSEVAASLPAGLTAGTAPVLSTGRLYALQLKGQSQVRFVVSPASSKPAEGSYGGLATLKVEKGGVYRVALDQKVWIDVLADNAAIEARDFQGRAGCNAPHKIVEFLLPPPGTPLTLQLSGSSNPVVRVTVTRAPDGQASDPAPRQ